MPTSSARAPRVPFSVRIRLLLPLLGLTAACGSARTPPADVPPTTSEAVAPLPAPATPISQFVRRIHEDARGHLWLGTNGDGVARWNGTRLEWFRAVDGLPGAAVRAIVEDRAGNVWIGTEAGVTRYDGKRFVHHTSRDGLPDNVKEDMETLENAAAVFESAMMWLVAMKPLLDTLNSNKKDKGAKLVEILSQGVPEI